MNSCPIYTGESSISARTEFIRAKLQNHDCTDMPPLTCPPSHLPPVAVAAGNPAASARPQSQSPLRVCDWDGNLPGPTRSAHARTFLVRAPHSLSANFITNASCALSVYQGFPSQPRAEVDACMRMDAFGHYSHARFTFGHYLPKRALKDLQRVKGLAVVDV